VLATPDGASIHPHRRDRTVTENGTQFNGSEELGAASEGEQTIVRILDLPEGTDYVVFQDANVVALASRLDEAGRRRALTDADVR
jgi:hypothetical protein